MTSEIKVDTISEQTSANGVAIDGVTLKDNGITASGDVSLDGGSFVFNESGADKDFRIEGDTQANLFFADASTDRVGIGTNAPDMLLDVFDSICSRHYLQLPLDYLILHL